MAKNSLRRITSVSNPSIKKIKKFNQKRGTSYFYPPNNSLIQWKT